MLRVVFPYIEVGLIVKAAANEVWQILVDTSRWVEWGPSIRAVECTERFLTALFLGPCEDRSGILGALCRDSLRTGENLVLARVRYSGNHAHGGRSWR